MLTFKDVKHGIPVYSGSYNAAVIDMAEGVKWLAELVKRGDDTDYWGTGGLKRVQTALRDGDMEMAREAEKYLSAFEDMAFEGKKFQNVNAIAGGAPNIGAYLAGSPLAMRRRQRTISDVGTLTIFVDGSSSGDVSADALKRRGAALLGLVQMLKTVRPVELYVVGGGMPNGNSRLSCSVFVKIEGTMDLSRDGFAVAHPDFTRNFLYLASADLDGSRRYNGMLAWEFGGVYNYRKHALRAFCNVINCDIEQSIFFSPPHSNDPVIDNPVKWIKDMFEQYKGKGDDQ